MVIQPFRHVAAVVPLVVPQLVPRLGSHDLSASSPLEVQAPLQAGLGISAFYSATAFETVVLSL